jgi:hypothetical protein
MWLIEAVHPNADPDDVSDISIIFAGDIDAAQCQMPGAHGICPWLSRRS